jgi:carbamoyl-phosphate synthase large subunit
MPKRTDIHSVLIIGAGPIIIGQACEFDYSGTQACKALREEGYRVVLVNSNPATIMTDPEFADRTYIEPITPEAVEKIIAREKAEMLRLGVPSGGEKPHKLVLLPTLGGQTALNTAMALHKNGALERHGIEMIGAKPAAIHRGEDRQAFTLGGTGGGIAYNRDEFEEIARRGIDLSPVNEVLIEESLLGWKEYEMEVMRDRADNCVIICSIENFDPMGIHTGDSITVAPIQTLTDKEYQIMRDQSFAVIRAVGVETGGSNIQFGVNPDNGRMVIIEMNPRVSRSSALASKATGFPIAKIAAKLAVGYLLDEIRNDITRETPASFEPTIDYVVTKVPRFAFEKFPQADPTLTTQMKSVGEAMAIGRTFKESLQKCLRSLEIGRSGLGGDGKPWRIGTEVYGDRDILPRDVISRKLSVPNAERIFFIRHALRAGFTIDEIFNLTKIDRWFLTQIKEIVDFEEVLARTKN